MTHESSIYTRRNFAVQFEAVLHERHIDDFHAFPPVQDASISGKAHNFDLVLNFLTKQKPPSVKNDLDRALYLGNIPHARHRRALDLTVPQEKSKSFAPITIGKRLRIMSEWDETSLCYGETPIRINPDVSFSLERQTATFLSLEMVLELVRGGKRVLDLGAGSGATSIAAAKLGAGSIDALESDMDLMKCAESNIRRNNCSAKINLFCGSYDNIPHNDYHVVLSHIGIDSLMKRFDRITKTVTKMHYFVASGIPQERSREFNSFLLERGLFPSIIMQKNEWCAYLLRTRRG